MPHEPPTPLEIAPRVRAALHTALETPGVRRLGRALRHLPERGLHPARRRRARARLRERPFPQAVLFVCYGNLYRSPFAARLFGSLLPEPVRQRVEVSSAGFVAPGRRSPAAAVARAAARGLNLTAHSSSLLNPDRVRKAALIVVMDAVQQRAICGRFGRSPREVIVLGDLDPHPIATRTIEDPWGQPEEVLVSSFARIERCVTALVAALFQEDDSSADPPAGRDAGPRLP